MLIADDTSRVEKVASNFVTSPASANIVGCAIVSDKISDCIETHLINGAIEGTNDESLGIHV